MNPKMQVSIRWISGILFLISALVFWYIIAADYGYGAVSGEYIFRGNGEISILVLNHDRTFLQEVSRAGKIERAQGNWRRIGEGGVVFSREFLKLAGQEVRPDGQADGEIRKRFLGLFFSIRFEPDFGGPTFNKRMWIH